MPKGARDGVFQYIGSLSSPRAPSRCEATGAGIQLEQISAATLLREEHLEQKKTKQKNSCKSNRESQNREQYCHKSRRSSPQHSLP